MMTSTTVDAVDFRTAMARHAAGVTVVTTLDKAGTPAGFTASAFSSVSLNPPLILVCLNRTADCYPAFRAAGHFAVSILAAGQAHHARRFAAKGTDKFAAVAVEPGTATGLPLLTGACAQLECRTHEQLEGGDHVILVGEVLRAVSSDREPLVHFNRRLGRFTSD